MISLNLISPSQKVTLEARIVYALLERLMILIVSLILVLTIALLGAKIDLTNRLSETQARQILTGEYSSANKEIGLLNMSIAHIEHIQDAAQPVTPVLFDVFGRVPNGVQLTSVTYDKASRNMTLSGLADTRDDLLAFSERLRGSSYVQRVDSPISNLFKKTDVSFSLQAIIVSATSP